MKLLTVLRKTDFLSLIFSSVQKKNRRKNTIYDTQQSYSAKQLTFLKDSLLDLLFLFSHYHLMFSCMKQQ